MSGRAISQLVRLRALRLDRRQTELAEARSARAEADATLAAREAGEARAKAETLDERHALAGDPGDSELRLALVDRRRFAEALAAEQRQDASRAAGQAEHHERTARAAMIDARRRHDAIDAQAVRVRRAEATLAEEREAIEQEQGPRR